MTVKQKRRFPWKTVLGAVLLIALCAGALQVWRAATGELPPGGQASTSDEEAPDASQEAGTSGEAAGAAEEPEGSDAAGEQAEEPDPIAARAQELLDGMTLEEKVGQMFIARCPETDAAQLAADYHLGGYILFGRDFKDKTAEQVTADIQSYQGAAEIPLLIAVDEEGGTVNRVSSNPNLRSSPFRSPQSLYSEGGLELVRSDAQEKCRLLESLGININFAPVCDVSQDPADFIYDRTLGRDAQETSQYVAAVVETMAEEGMGSVLKHFPGYGNNTDTHTGVAYDDRPYDTFLTSDFLPFQAGIAAGADMVLVSHNIVSAMDEASPASLSPEVHRVLREDLGFTGVIVTDDLVMDGVRDFAGDDEAAVLAVQAGNDLLCCTDFQTQVPAVLAAVESGEITGEQIDAAVLRVLTMKLRLGIL
ncbi:MAG TPA: beta-hexosaminidase [Candidatus Pelethomonas intestinigallinarum]|nr:beta-hexosaminidase [Candidatus Pelethomonas intestinigallinarum]